MPSAGLTSAGAAGDQTYGRRDRSTCQTRVCQADVRQTSVRQTSVRQTNVRQTSAYPGVDAAAGITEIVLSQQSPQPLQLVLPMLAHLSRGDQQRWITWISRQRLERRLLQAYGVDSAKLRLVYPTREADILWITWEALAAGNSHTVVASPGRISEQQFSQLDQAACQGEARGIMLRSR